jgi:hypothetical protein
MGSVEEYIAKYGKPVKVNGVVFNTCKSAAKYIAETEPGKEDKMMTIAKELRKFCNGERASWYMYHKYLIEEA